MSPVDYVKKVFRNYANFNGRANRPEYWWYVLFLIIVSIVFNILIVATGGSTIINVLNGLWSLGTLVPSLAVSWRRMQDVGKPGWFMLIPFYNLYLFCLKGDAGPNKYGPDPENPNESFDFEQNKLTV